MVQIISGLRELAPDYDALVCDVWGVLHDGHTAHLDACAALRIFRDTRGPVVLLTNAPRPVKDVEELFVKKYGVPLDCYDAIVTSGVATRDALALLAIQLNIDTKTFPTPILHLGPERDRGIFDRNLVDFSDVSGAQLIVCTGLYDDDVETPDDYIDLLNEMKTRNLTMLCANPDWQVQRGGKLVYCAGALANEYEKVGGKVVYYGKPYREIYESAFAAARLASGGFIGKPLAIGDGMHTDIKGANAAALDALFIADGVHGEDVAEFTPEHLDALFKEAGVQARAAMRKLVW